MQSSPGQEVELFFSARHLKKMDMLSESDPFCRVLFKDSFMPSFSPLGQTEVLQNQPNPNWATTFKFRYLFEVEQTLAFEVLDSDGARGELIGKASTKVGNIFTNKGTLVLDIHQDGRAASTGKLIVRGEQVQQSKEMVRFEMRATHVDDVDWFSKSDPFLVISRLREDGSLLKVHQTEAIDNNLNPVWRPWTMSVQTLCNGDHFLPLVLECWDDESSGKHQFIGKAEASLDQLMKRPELPLINPKKLTKRKYQNSGILHIANCQVWTEVDFLDYLKGGVELSLMVAIDFTGSNGQPSFPNSLHYLNPAGPNSYERAIWAVGGILEAYDSDKTFEVWGFGGKPPGMRDVSHCFSLADGNVVGVPGIINAYRTCLAGVELSGPTLFSHILTTASDIARRSPPGTKYHVLLILTDGAIHDMPETKRIIVDSSNLPLSIIIVGIGNADFGNMEELDSDATALRDSSGRAAARDIVQFVPFNKFEGDGVRLAQEVLAEVPKQLLGFMKANGVEPRPVQSVPLVQMNVVDPAVSSMMGGMVQGFLRPTAPPPDSS